MIITVSYHLLQTTISCATANSVLSRLHKYTRDKGVIATGTRNRDVISSLLAGIAETVITTAEFMASYACVSIFTNTFENARTVDEDRSFTATHNVRFGFSPSPTDLGRKTEVNMLNALRGIFLS